MEVTDAKSCAAWLRAWSGRPPRGILLECIRGQRARAGLLKRTRPQDAANATEAADMMQRVLDGAL